MCNSTLRIFVSIQIWPIPWITRSKNSGYNAHLKFEQKIPSKLIDFSLKELRRSSSFFLSRSTNEIKIVGCIKVHCFLLILYYRQFFLLFFFCLLLLSSYKQKPQNNAIATFALKHFYQLHEMFLHSHSFQLKAERKINHAIVMIYNVIELNVVSIWIQFAIFFNSSLFHALNSINSHWCWCLSFVYLMWKRNSRGTLLYVC